MVVFMYDRKFLMSLQCPCALFKNVSATDMNSAVTCCVQAVGEVWHRWVRCLCVCICIDICVCVIERVTTETYGCDIWRQGTTPMYFRDIATYIISSYYNRVMYGGSYSHTLFNFSLYMHFGSHCFDTSAFPLPLVTPHPPPLHTNTWPEKCFPSH